MATGEAGRTAIGAEVAGLGATGGEVGATGTEGVLLSVGPATGSLVRWTGVEHAPSPKARRHQISLAGRDMLIFCGTVGDTQDRTEPVCPGISRVFHLAFGLKTGEK